MPYQPSRLLDPPVEMIERRERHTGFMTVWEYLLRVRRFDGSLSPVLSREVARFGKTGMAVLVLPYHAPSDQVILVEQFRISHHLNQRPSCWQLEAVAGLVEPEEASEVAAHREVQEEAGCSVRELLPLGRVASTPGGYLEQFDLFIARCDLPEHGSLAGLASEHEDIRVHVLPFAEALALADSGVIEHAVTALLLNRLARERDKLRKLWA